MIWQQLTVDADAIATTEDAVITTVVVLSGLLFFFCSAVAAITAAVADAVSVVAVAEMMVVVVGFGSSFFCSAAAAGAADVAAITSAAKQNIKQDPNHLWFGSCFRLTAALTFFLSRPCKSRLVTCSFLVVSVLLLFHALIINFVNRISIYD